MKFANHGGRFVVVLGDDEIVDVETASAGRFGPSPEAVFADWADFRDWTRTASLVSAERLVTEQLGPPSPRPPQIFGIGLNYKSHVEEAGMAAPDTPLTFTKFPSSVIGPTGDITITGPQVDWEVELVVVIGSRAHSISADRGVGLHCRCHARPGHLRSGGADSAQGAPSVQPWASRCPVSPRSAHSWSPPTSFAIPTTCSWSAPSMVTRCKTDRTNG